MCGCSSRPTLEIELRRLAWPLHKKPVLCSMAFPAKDDTHFPWRYFHGSRKIGAVELTGAVPVPPHLKKNMFAIYIEEKNNKL